ncbi:alpha/beta-hydrolase [Phellopilus nigrolimitatus]|nr:alpha/beta-hydrolase [Phellopilus nigrolimitatus]
MPGRAAVRRSPPFLESLARSALPTASVTRPPPALRQPTDHTLVPSEDGVDEPCIDITQSPPVRSSLDSLRQLQDRNNPAIPPGIPGTSKPRSLSSSSGPSRWWFGGDRKADVDELLDESDQADTIEGEEAHLRKKYRAPKNPVVFCHGLLGFDSVQIGPAIAPMSVSHWRGIKEVLEARGIEVLITRVPATSSPVERAKVLEAKVSEVYPGRAVHLIGAVSQGGLDCRYLTTHLTQRKFRVLSITTVATPHRGSSFADHFIATVGKQRIPSFVSLLDLLPNGGGDGKAFESLTLGAMRRFNEETPDVEGVKYFSWGAVFDPGLIDAFKWPHSVIMEKEGPNDGLVSVASSKWGTYLGTLEDVNHLDLVGWINTARYKWAEFTGREIKFKPATFYLGVADHLARHVEGQERVPSSAGGSRRPSEEDVVAAEHSKAGKGVSTVEGVEHQGPRTPPDEGESSSDRLDVRIPMPDSSSSRRRSSS